MFLIWTCRAKTVTFCSYVPWTRLLLYILSPKSWAILVIRLLFAQHVAALLIIRENLPATITANLGHHEQMKSLTQSEVQSWFSSISGNILRQSIVACA